MKYRAYTKYKDSGVEWLGDVPEHWNLKAIKWTTPVFRGASPRPIDDPVYFDDEGEYAWVRIADVTAAGVYLEETTQRLSDVGSSLSVKMQPGSLFISVAGTVGLPCITKIKCCIHDGFVYFPRLKSHTKFMYYIFACGEPYKGLGKMGTQLNLNTDTIGSIIIGFPPLPEQQVIANFLDRETGRIDTLIASKMRLLELLAEQRTALISRAVTKGLDTTIKMKPSGVERLGDVPEHWNVKRLKNAFSIYSGSTPESSKEEYWDGDINWITPEDLGNNSSKVINDSRRKITKEGYSSIGATIVPPNSIIISTRAPIGHLSINSIPSCTNQGCRSLVPLREYSSDYYYYYLLISKGYLNATGKGTTFLELSTQGLGSFCIIAPPFFEQQAIAAFLDRETEKNDLLSVKITAVIERLKEYRTALISSVVTGKIDVRGEK